MLSDDDARELSEEFAFLVQGGQPRIVQFRDGKIFGTMSIQAFCFLVANRIPGFPGLGKAWISHKLRKTYPRSTFDPGNTDTDTLNYYRGLAITPVLGNCEIGLEFIREVICKGDEKLYRWVLAWLSKLCREPNKKPGTCIVLRGEQGTGKTTFANFLREIFGEAATTLNSPSQLTGKFNADLAQKILVVLDEAPVTKAHANAVKEIITGSTLRCEPKGVDAFDVPNNIWLLICTNERQVITAQGDERRYCVIDVSSARRGDKEYFANIDAWVMAGGLAHLLDYLQNYDGSECDLRTVPQTNALAEQKQLSFDLFDRSLHDMIQSGSINGSAWPRRIGCDDLIDAINAYRFPYERPLSGISIGMRLKSMFENCSKTRDGSGVRKWYWVLPNLEEAKKIFAAKKSIANLFEEAEVLDQSVQPVQTRSMIEKK